MPLVLPLVFPLPITRPVYLHFLLIAGNSFFRSSLTAPGLPIGYHTNSSPFAGLLVYHLPLLRKFPTYALRIHRITPSPHEPRRITTEATAAKEEPITRVVSGFL